MCDVSLLDIMSLAAVVAAAPRGRVEQAARAHPTFAALVPGSRALRVVAPSGDAREYPDVDAMMRGVHAWMRDVGDTDGAAVMGTAISRIESHLEAEAAMMRFRRMRIRRKKNRRRTPAVTGLEGMFDGLAI